ncbi:hypothetical protein M758_9G065900 [Ceratodon purpureus]|nr:hypothetical protein M758_9G065900 [Ceratodon purpureus]
MSSSFSQTLNSITVTKLHGISKQVTDFNSHRERILSSLSAASSSRERVRILLDGVNSWLGSADSSSSLGKADYLQTVRKFLVQAEHDPCIGEATLREWETDFTKALDTEKAKYEYAELFGRLLSEWIASTASIPEKPSDKQKLTGNKEAFSASEMSDDTFEKVGRKEMHEQRAKFESLVFTAEETDTVAILADLDDLFSSKAAKESLALMRDEIGLFGNNFFRDRRLYVRNLKSVISSLVVADLLSNEKRETLKEFTQNNTILTEVTDVLNMHLSSLESWSWIPDGSAMDAIPVEMRRQINGKYRIYMDEDILQAIFLHWIGLEWAVEFRKHFKSIFNSSAWKQAAKPLSKQEKERREYFLADERRGKWGEGPTSIDEARRAKQREMFFMSQLSKSLEEVGAGYDEDGGAKPGEVTAVGIKQSLLHILTTECLFNTTIHDKFTVVRSDFAWFGPSLPHSSIMTALRFFGVPEVWLTFFQKFLSAPLEFRSDGPMAAPQIRKRGVPMSHSLSGLFGEVLLFCMDYAVNQRADGLFLYRIHDDFWLWNNDATVCVKAWQVMSSFTKLVGLEFNYEKTGSVSVGQPLHPDLPRGTIKWGFLNFEESGQFVIDQSQVDVHIDELKLQLKACEHSVFAWVQAYNKYVASFFVNNFGSPPAQCFGQRHIDMVILTLERIHLALFPNHGGSVIEYLAHVIQERFGVHDIPPGWFLWPIAMGGLEVKSPLIPQYVIRDALCVDPSKKFEDALDAEKELYAQLQEKWENGTTAKPYTCNKSLETEPFLSYEEYSRHRELRFESWMDVYEELLKVPEDAELVLRPDSVPSNVIAELSKLSRKFQKSDVEGIAANWSSMNAYWRWVVACFSGGVVKKWGGLEVVRPESLPMGMVEVWKSRKVRWEQ